MSYYTKITTAGLAAITAAMNNSSKVPITYMAFGDGNGFVPEPDENASSLINEVYRVGLNKIEVHSKNPNWLVCEAIIPSAVGGFNIREVALYDSTGNTILAIASYPPTYKPTVEEGAAKIQTIRIVIQVENSGNFELIVDPDIVLATIGYVDNKFNKNILKKDLSSEYFIYKEVVDNKSDLQQLINTSNKSRIIIPDLGYPLILSDNILIPDNKTLEIQAIIEQKTDGRELATKDKISSDYPVFKIIGNNSSVITSENGKIYSYYEAVQIVGTESSGVMSIKNPTIDVNCKCISVDDGYGQFAGITTYATENLDLCNSKAVGYGKRPTWDATNNKMNYGGYGGFLIYLSNGVKGNITAINNGGNGVFTFACNDYNLEIEAHYNGTSGFQLAPSNAPWFKCGGRVTVHATNNYADGFDVRWTGAGRVSLGNLVVKTTCENNGFFENDKTKPTQDGSGIATFAFVKDAIILPSTSKDSAGSALYVQGCDNIKSAGRSIATVYTTKEGLFIGNTCSDIDIDFDVKTRGTALSFAGSQTLTNIYLKGRYKSTETRGVVVADTTTYSDVCVNAEIESGAVDVYLAGKVNFDGSKFINKAGGKYYVTDATGSMRNTSAEFSSGGVVANNIRYVDLTGVNYVSESGNALVLERCTHPMISGNVYSKSGRALSLTGEGSDFTNNVHLRSLKLKSDIGEALYSVSTNGIFDEGGLVIEGEQNVTGSGVSKVPNVFTINQSWPVGTIAAGVTKSATFTLLGVKANSIAHVSLSSGAKGGLLYTEVISANEVKVIFTNITSATIDLGNPNVKIQVFNH